MINQPVVHTNTLTQAGLHRPCYLTPYQRYQEPLPVS